MSTTQRETGELQTFRVFLPETRTRKKPWILVDARDEEQVRGRYHDAGRITPVPARPNADRPRIH